MVMLVLMTMLVVDVSIEVSREYRIVTYNFRLRVGWRQGERDEVVKMSLVVVVVQKLNITPQPQACTLPTTSNSYPESQPLSYPKPARCYPLTRNPRTPSLNPEALNPRALNPRVLNPKGLHPAALNPEAPTLKP